MCFVVAFCLCACVHACMHVFFYIAFTLPIRLKFPWADPEGGTGGSDPPWNCQIINFCHVGIFCQTPSGTLDPL